MLQPELPKYMSSAALLESLCSKDKSIHLDDAACCTSRIYLLDRYLLARSWDERHGITRKVHFFLGVGFVWDTKLHE